MLFTVFQYVPILEEETPGHKVELAKKAKQGDMDGDNDGAADDDCDDDDTEQEFNYFCNSFYNNTFYTQEKSRFSVKNNLYKYLLEQKDTPPPKG